MALLSPFGNLFIAIQNRITSQVAAVKWVDQNFDQLLQDRPAVIFPCALIDLVGWSFEDLSDGLQRGTGQVVISVATAPFSPSNNKANISYKEKALNFYEVEYEIVKALHNWAPAGFDKLKRRVVDKNENELPIRERVIVFETGYTDTAGQPTRTLLTPHAPVIGSDILP